MAAPLIAGTCMGVLYLDSKTNTIMVHNGRLKTMVPNPGKITNAVTIIHVPKTNLVPEELTITKPFAISRTPDFAPAPCKNQKPTPAKPSLIKSGTCFALTFTANGEQDVKNGRFLYAITTNNKLTCSLPIDPKTHSITNNIKKVVYMHMNEVQQGTGHLAFLPQIVERVNVKKAIALPLSAKNKRSI